MSCTIWKTSSEVFLLHLFYQLRVVFFDLHADRYVRESPENILQQSDLPVSAGTVAPCRRETPKVKFTLHMHVHTHVFERTHLHKMSPPVCLYREAGPAGGEEPMDAGIKIWLFIKLNDVMMIKLISY